MAVGRGAHPQRSIVHLHSPFSHDACDGMGLVDGTVNESCLADLRDALCRVHVDVAFITDHPDYAAEHSFSDLLLRRDGDQPIEVDGTTVGNRIVCSDGHTVDWMFGVEDELMPLGSHEVPAGIYRWLPPQWNPADRPRADPMALSTWAKYWKVPKSKVGFLTTQLRTSGPILPNSNSCPSSFARPIYFS